MLKFHKLIIYILTILFIFVGMNSVKAVEDEGEWEYNDPNEISFTFSDDEITPSEEVEGYEINGTTLTIMDSGEYTITGSSNSGNIIVEDGASDITLKLDNLTLTSGEDNPILFEGNNDNCNISLLGSNYLTSGDLRKGSSISDAVIKILDNSFVAINGSGVLNLYGNSEDGIKTSLDTELIIQSGNVNIDAVNTGINYKGSFRVESANVTIEAGEYGIYKLYDDEESSKDEDIYISGGKLNINSDNIGISTEDFIQFQNSAKCTINSRYDGIITKSDFMSDDSNIDITTFGGYDMDGFDFETMSAKGIAVIKKEDEGNPENSIRISGGKTTLNTQDDALSSDVDIIIERGTFNIQSGKTAISAYGMIGIGEENGLERNPYLTISDSETALKASDIMINSGKIYANSLDRGIVAFQNEQSQETPSINIYGGNIYINSGSNALSSFGDVYIDSSKVELWGEESEGENSPINYENDIMINNSTVFAAGTRGEAYIHDKIDIEEYPYIFSNDDYVSGSSIYVLDDSKETLFSAVAPKDVDYVFYISPTSNSSYKISSAGNDNCTGNAWSEEWDEGVITTPATSTSLGVKTYTSSCGKTEKENYNFIDLSSNYFLATEISDIHLDGENDDTVTLFFGTANDVSFNELQAKLSLDSDNNNYFEIIDMKSNVNEGDVNINSDEGTISFNNQTGYSFEQFDNIMEVTYKIKKNTPSGLYRIYFASTSYDNEVDKGFDWYTDFIITREDDLKAVFDTDEGIDSIGWFHTNNYSNTTEDNYESETYEAYALNGTTGDKGSDGNDEVNFKINLKDGYVLKNISVLPEGRISKIIGPGETGNSNTYRITGVTKNIKVSIETKEAESYTTAFTKDSHISSIDNYYTQDYTNKDTSNYKENINNAIVRNKDTGNIDITGNGEVSFVVNPENGYKVSNILVDGIYKNLEDPSITKEDNLYRLTKVSGDVSVNIQTKQRVSITPEITGYEESYSYTGSSIKPNITLKVPGQDAILVENIDYKVVYGENTSIGENSGSITISPINTSDYMFDERTIHFDIDRYEITEDNISIPSDITYIGETLTPEVVISANGKTLEKDTDYTIEYSNQDGEIGENIVVTIEGIGNYKTTTPIVKNVLISGKKMQTLSFEHETLTKPYGEEYIEEVIITQGDGNITYSSSNTNVAKVNSTTGKVTVVGVGEALITATASETTTFEETTASYTLNAEKATLKITGAQIESKEYDGTTNATISNITISGLVFNDKLVRDKDYKVSAAFITKTTGFSKGVKVTVTLLSDNIKNKYKLDKNTFNSTANVTQKKIPSNSIKLGSTSYIYGAKYRTPTVTITINGIELVRNTDFTVRYDNNKMPGTAKVIIEGKGNYTGSVTKHFKINKRNQTMTVKVYNKTLKYKKVKKKKQIISKVIVPSKSQGKVTYLKQSGSSKILVNKKTGKITVKKKTKKGTYKIKVKVTAAGTSTYKSGSKVVTVKIRVK